MRILAFILLLSLPLQTYSKSKKLVPINVGETPPSYLGIDKNGDRVELTDLTGKIVIVSFWASWCSPCMKELPILENIQRKLGSDKIRVIAVNYKESRKQFRHIKRKLTHLELTITSDEYGSIGRSYGVKSVPNLFLIAKDGRLLMHKIGYGEKTVDSIVEMLNKEL